jgi:hypothetical protein
MDLNFRSTANSPPPSPSSFLTRKGARFHAFQHLVEVVAVDVDELAVLETLLLDFRIAAEVADHAHHERQFLVLDGVADLDVVSHLHPWRADFLQFLLHASALGHGYPLLYFRAPNGSALASSS